MHGHAERGRRSECLRRSGQQYDVAGVEVFEEERGDLSAELAGGAGDGNGHRVPFDRPGADSTRLNCRRLQVA
jgi:hypothetical protein